MVYLMAFIKYVPEEEIPEADRVADRDNILRIHGIHSRTMKLHDALYRALMFSRWTLRRITGGGR